MKTLLLAIWNFLSSLNRSKVVHGITLVLAVAIGVLVIIQPELSDGTKLEVGIGVVLAALTRTQFLWQKVIKLMDGSSVIQVKPSVTDESPSLRSVAVSPGKVKRNVKPAKIVLLAVVLASGPALADGAPAESCPVVEPSALVSCSSSSKLCFGPSTSVSVAALNLKTGKIEAGLSSLPVGVCYGVTYLRGESKAVGADVCFNIVFGQDVATSLMPSLMLHASNWGYVGIGALGRQGAREMYWQGMFLFGIRVAP